MKPARLLPALFAMLVVASGFLVPADASATVQRVVLVEEFGFHT